MAALPEIREAEATGGIAEIYAGLRAAIGIPLVNLIYRHLATRPGVLPWVWGAIRGCASAPALEAGRARMAEAVHAQGLGARLAAALALDDPGREVRALVEAYNRGNAMNLLLLTTLRRHLAGEAGGGPVAAVAVPARQGPAPAPLPPIPRLDALPPAVAAEVRALAALHGAEAGGVVPSLYLHLALWPAVLPPLRAALALLFADGTVARARDAACAVAEVTAAELLPALGRPPAPFPEAHRAATLAVLETFTRQIIPAMVPIGVALHEALPRAT
ncbi:MAG: hypothetical protein IRZ13_16950 [Acetobacteraceae bacterium]|nr:hypothetical protein [Acetobacteraceae bacterium]